MNDDKSNFIEGDNDDNKNNFIEGDNIIHIVHCLLMMKYCMWYNMGISTSTNSEWHQK